MSCCAAADLLDRLRKALVEREAASKSYSDIMNQKDERVLEALDRLEKSSKTIDALYSELQDVLR